MTATVQRRLSRFSVDDLIQQLYAMLAEHPPSRCGIEGHDCNMPYACMIAALQRAERMGFVPDILCAPPIPAYPEPPYQLLYEDDENTVFDPDDGPEWALDLGKRDSDGFDWSDAMRWMPP